MPHITIKMLKGRTDEQKKQAADKVAAALVDAIGRNIFPLLSRILLR